MTKFRIGVVGYCHPTKFDREKSWKLLHEGLMRALSDSSNKDVMVVGGLTDIPSMHQDAYYIARQNKWNCGGIACEKAKDFKWFPMSEDGDMLKIVGKGWGDESETFVDNINALVRVGGGPQAKKEVNMAREKGLPVYEYELETE